MTTPRMDSEAVAKPAGQSSRRTLLKAASAAGIVWASPVLHSVTAYAAGSCESVQFTRNGGGAYPAGITTLPSTDWTCPPGTPLADLPLDCTPAGGSNSQCSNCTWQAGVVSASPGILVNNGVAGFSYTAPAGCTIFSATARRVVPGASGCRQRFPCDAGTLSSSTTATFPAPPAGLYFAFRFLLCCTP